MTESAIRSFLEVLATIRESFRRTEIELAKSGKLKNIQVTASPFRIGERASFTFSIDGDLVRDSSNGSPLGLSIKIEALDSAWLLEEYIHFPHGDIDWFEYEEREDRSTSFEELLNVLPAFSEQSLYLYRRVVLAA